MMNVIRDEWATMEAKWKNSSVEYDKWRNVIIDGISVKTQRQKNSKGNVRVMREKFSRSENGPKKFQLRNRRLDGDEMI